jgi:thiol-disulfide isomerase/thioredoxin
MRRIWFGLVFLFLTVTTPAQSGAGYRISVAIDGLADSTVYLAYHLGDKQYIKDTLNLDSNGSGILSGNNSLEQGIYMIVLPGRKYFEVLMPEDQQFSVTCSFSDFFNTLRFSGSDENNAFIEYQRNWISLQEQAAAINKRIQNNRQNNDSIAMLTELRVKQEEKMKSYLRDVADGNKGTLLALLVKSIIPVEVPEFQVPSNSSNPDSVKWMMSYEYNKNHYFDNIDFSDERILRTPILQSKLNVFFTNVIIQLADSINREIDKIFKRCSGNYKVFQFVAVYLFNHFRESEIMGHDAVIVKLADDIYLSGKADWTTSEWRDNLKKEVDRIRPNLIGVKAHDLVMNTFNGVYVSLYDIKKDFTILYFWEPDCGHCREETPKLKAYYDKVKNDGIEVFAICTQTDREKWEKYIQENKLNWINGWDPQRLTNFDYYYNITTTPTVYILDSNKTIIAKRLPVESIESFIDNFRKYNYTHPTGTN